MHCLRCNSHMIVMERIEQPRSTQTWYECTNCSGQRLRTADRRGPYLETGGPPATGFRSETDVSGPSGRKPASYRTHKRAV